MIDTILQIFNGFLELVIFCYEGFKSIGIIPKATIVISFFLMLLFNDLTYLSTVLTADGEINKNEESTFEDKLVIDFFKTVHLLQSHFLKIGFITSALIVAACFISSLLNEINLIIPLIYSGFLGYLVYCISAFTGLYSNLLTFSMESNYYAKNKADNINRFINKGIIYESLVYTFASLLIYFLISAFYLIMSRFAPIQLSTESYTYVSQLVTLFACFALISGCCLTKFFDIGTDLAENHYQQQNIDSIKLSRALKSIAAVESAGDKLGDQSTTKVFIYCINLVTFLSRLGANGNIQDVLFGSIADLMIAHIFTSLIALAMRQSQIFEGQTLMYISLFCILLPLMTSTNVVEMTVSGMTVKEIFNNVFLQISPYVSIVVMMFIYCLSSGIYTWAVEATTRANELYLGFSYYTLISLLQYFFINSTSFPMNSLRLCLIMDSLGPNMDNLFLIFHGNTLYNEKDHPEDMMVLKNNLNFADSIGNAIKLVFRATLLSLSINTLNDNMRFSKPSTLAVILMGWLVFGLISIIHNVTNAKDIVKDYIEGQLENSNNENTSIKLFDRLSSISLVSAGLILLPFAFEKLFVNVMFRGSYLSTLIREISLPLGVFAMIFSCLGSLFDQNKKMNQIYSIGSRDTVTSLDVIGDFLKDVLSPVLLSLFLISIIS